MTDWVDWGSTTVPLDSEEPCPECGGDGDVQSDDDAGADGIMPLSQFIGEPVEDE